MTTIRAQTTSIATTNQQILEELQLTRQTLNSLLQAVATELQAIRNVNESQLDQLLGIIENTGIAAERVDQFLPQISLSLNNLLFAQRACCLPIAPPDLPLLPPSLPPITPVTSDLCRRMRAIAYQYRDLFALLVDNAIGVGALSATLVTGLVGTVLAPETVGLSIVVAGAIAAAITSALGLYVRDQIVPADEQLESMLIEAFAVRQDGWEAANEAFGPAVEAEMGLAGRAFRVFFIALSGFRRAFDEDADLGDISQYPGNCGQAAGWLGHVDYVDFGSPVQERIYRWGSPIVMTNVNPFGNADGPARYFSPGGGVPGGSVFWNSSDVTVTISLWSGQTLIVNQSVSPGEQVTLDDNYTLGYVATSTSVLATTGTLRFLIN